VRRTGTAAGLGLLAVTAAALFAATSLDPGVQPDDGGIALGRLVAWYVLLVGVAALGALSIAHRGARTVETLFERQDDLMLTVAHEIRRPLSRAMVALEEGLGGTRAPERAFADAQRNVDELARLIEDLLETARIMSGAIDLPQEEVRLDDVARGAVGDAQVGLSTIHFATRPTIVDGSPHLLRRAVSNLIRNAALHGYADRAGEIRVRVDTTGVSVEDDGPGIPPEQLDELRSERPMARRRSGRLGLALAGWVAETHRGRLVLRNRPEGGLEARLEIGGRRPPTGEGPEGS
jgi:two-component system OmpR family sensor kinase